MATFKKELKAAYRQTALIGAAMVGALVLYVVIVEMLKRAPIRPTGLEGLKEYLYVIRYAVFGLAVGSIFGIRFYRKMFLVARITLRLNFLPYKSFSPVPQRLQFVSITTLAFCEAVAIYGIALFFVGRSSQDFYILLTFSVVLFAIYFPRFSEWEDLAKKLAQEKR